MTNEDLNDSDEWVTTKTAYKMIRMGIRGVRPLEGLDHHIGERISAHGRPPTVWRRKDIERVRDLIRSAQLTLAQAARVVAARNAGKLEGL